MKIFSGTDEARKLKWAHWIVLLAVLLAYANSFQNGFHFDDFHTVTDNPAVRSLRNVPLFFRDATSFSVLPANRTYRPVVSTSLAVDYMLGRGYEPVWFHVLTFAWFLLLIVVLWKLYERLLDAVSPDAPGRRRNAWLGLLGAAWFGLHPAMAETVNYVIQRGDLYCTLGCVGALYLYASRPQWRKTGLYLGPLVLALLSKPPAAVFPVLLFFYVAFFEVEGQADRWRRSAMAVVPSVIVVAVLLWVSSAMTPKTFLPSMISPWDYRLTQPYVWLRYFGALVLPVHLNVDTDLSPFTGVTLAEVVGLVFLLGLAAAISVTARRRVLYPIAYGLIWFVVTQLPTSLYPLSEVENDHRMFFSFVGLILAAVWGAYLLVQRSAAAERKVWLRPALAAVAVLALVGYAWGTHVRNTAWRTEESLWLDDVKKSPHNGRGLMIYGLTQMNKGAYPVALDYFTRALEFTPNYATLEINLGVVNGAMADLGDATRTAAAQQHFERAIALAPGEDTSHAFYGRWLNQHGRYAEAISELSTAVRLNPVRAFQHGQLISAYSNAGNAEGARQEAQDTLAVIPGDATATAALANPASVSTRGSGVAGLINLSLAQSKEGKYAESIASARKALEVDPGSAAAWNNIGAAQGAMHQWDEAIDSENRALKLDPALQIAANNLKWFREQKSAAGVTPKTAADFLNQSLYMGQAGRYDESIAAARSALRLEPASAEAWNNIAAAEEAMHHWDSAIAAAEKAIALKPDFQLAKNNLAWSVSQKKLGVR